MTIYSDWSIYRLGHLGLLTVTTKGDGEDYYTFLSRITDWWNGYGDLQSGDRVPYDDYCYPGEVRILQ